LAPPKAGRNGTKNRFSPESKKKVFSNEEQVFLGDVTTDVMVGRNFFLKLNKHLDVCRLIRLGFLGCFSDFLFLILFFWGDVVGGKTTENLFFYEKPSIKI
jgi:hypothetical protein